MAQTDPTPEDALNLFKDIERTFPSATLGDDKWHEITGMRHGGAPRHAAKGRELGAEEHGRLA